MLVGSSEYRKEQREKLLLFGLGSRNKNGFGYLDTAGKLIADKPEELYIICRMVYIYALALRLGEQYQSSQLCCENLREIATHGIKALLEGPIRDEHKDGWFDSLGDNPSKVAYAHAFVLLAAATAQKAGIIGAAELLEEVIAVVERYFWDEQAQMMVEEWDCDWQYCDSYRGINSNMHSVEAFLAVGYATGREKWYCRAAQISRRVLEFSSENNWRIPEHLMPLGNQTWNIIITFQQTLFVPTGPLSDMA